MLQSAHIKRVSVARMSVPILPSSRLMSARNAVKFWRTFVLSTTSNQFESHIFRSNFLKLVVAAQDYDILHSSHFPEIPGGRKWTFSSPQTFKLSSGEPKIIQLVRDITFCSLAQELFISCLKHQKSYWAVCSKALNTFDTTTCRPATILRRWLLNCYPAIQRQRKRTMSRLIFIKDTCTFL